MTLPGAAARRRAAWWGQGRLASAALVAAALIPRCAGRGPSVDAFCRNVRAAASAHSQLDTEGLRGGAHDPQALQQLTSQAATADAAVFHDLPRGLASDVATIKNGDRRQVAALTKAGFHDDQARSPLSWQDAQRLQSARAEVSRYEALVCTALPPSSTAQPAGTGVPR